MKNKTNKSELITAKNITSRIQVKRLQKREKMKR